MKWISTYIKHVKILSYNMKYLKRPWHNKSTAQKIIINKNLVKIRKRRKKNKKKDKKSKRGENDGKSL